MSEKPTHSPIAPFRPGILRFSATHLLVALIVLFITIPFVNQFKGGVLAESVATTIVLTSAVLVVGGRRRTLAIAVVLFSPTLIAKWFDLFRPSDLSREIVTATGSVFVGFIAGQLLLFVLRARSVNSEVLCAAISAYLLLGLLFSFAYAFVALLVPGAFLRVPPPIVDRPLLGFEALYFSFVTLSTVGYGDIVPVSNVARMLAMVEATSGMFYVTVLIARLVSVYAWETPARRPSDATSTDR